MVSGGNYSKDSFFVHESSLLWRKETYTVVSPKKSCSFLHMCSFEWLCETFWRKKMFWPNGHWNMNYNIRDFFQWKKIVKIVRAVLQILSTLGFGRAWATRSKNIPKTNQNSTTGWSPSLRNLSKILQWLSFFITSQWFNSQFAVIDHRQW